MFRELTIAHASLSSALYLTLQNMATLTPHSIAYMSTVHIPVSVQYTSITNHNFLPEKKVNLSRFYTYSDGCTCVCSLWEPLLLHCCSCNSHLDIALRGKIVLMLFSKTKSSSHRLTKSQFCYRCGQIKITILSAYYRHCNKVECIYFREFIILPLTTILIPLQTSLFNTTYQSDSKSYF